MTPLFSLTDACEACPFTAGDTGALCKRGHNMLKIMALTAIVLFVI